MTNPAPASDRRLRGRTTLGRRALPLLVLLVPSVVAASFGDWALRSVLGWPTSTDPLRSSVALLVGALAGSLAIAAGSIAFLFLRVVWQTSNDSRANIIERSRQKLRDTTHFEAKPPSRTTV